MIAKFINALPIPFGLQLVLLRLISQWRGLLILLIGVLLVAMIGTSIRLYTQAIAQIGLVDRIQQTPLDDVHIYVRTSISQASEIEPTWSDTHAIIADEIDPLTTVVNGWVAQFVQGIETLTIPTERADGTALPTNLRLAYYENLQASIEIVEGDLFPTANDDVIPVAIPELSAIRLDITVGDTLTLSYSRDGSQPIPVRITAIISEIDVQDPFMMNPSPMRVSNSGEANLFVTRDKFITLAQNNFPAMSLQPNWRVLFDYSALPFSEVIPASEQLDSTLRELDLALERPVINGDIADTLVQFNNEMNTLGTPFALLLAQVGLLVLLFLIVIASLIWRGEASEIDLYRTRGAQLRQILQSRALEIGILCAFGALIAPLLAYLLLTQLLPTIMNTDSVALTITREAYVLSAVASGLAWLVLMYSVTPVLRANLRSGGVQQKKQPWWYRYYLDIALLIFITADLWRLLQRSTTDTITNDPLLLLTPTLLFLAVGGVLLRIFPLLMRLLSKLVGRLPSLSRALAIWQISRESSHYVRIIFLLSLAISIGWFATSFQTTYQRNLVDRAQYAVGADIRLPVSTHTVHTTEDVFGEDYLAIDGVESVARVIRDDSISATTSTVSFGGGEALFVHQPDITQVAYLRPDLGTLPAPYVNNTPFIFDRTGTVLPATPQSFTLEMQLDLGFFQRVGTQYIRRDIDGFLHTDHFFVTTTLTDQQNTKAPLLFTIHPDNDIPAEIYDVMAAMNEQTFFTDTPELLDYIRISDELPEWLLLEAVIPDDYELDLSGEVRLDNLGVISFELPSVTTTWQLTLRNLTMTDTTGTTTELDWLTDNSWSMTDRFVSQETTTEGQQVAWLQTSNNFDITAFALLREYPTLEFGAIPVVASTEFLALNNLTVGDVFDLYVLGIVRNFVIVDETRYYPTLYETERPFIISDISALIYDDVLRGIDTDYEAEIWLNLSDTADIDAVMDEIRIQNSDIANSALVFDYQRNNLANDVLSLGLIGLLYLAFLMVLILSIVSLVAFSWLNARQRQSEFGFMLAIGIPPSRITVGIVLEQLVIMSIASIVGALMGIFLSRLVLPVLANSASRTPVTPPFFIQTEVAALLQFGLILAGILLVVMLLTTLTIQRLSLTQTLRLGEE